MPWVGLQLAGLARLAGFVLLGPFVAMARRSFSYPAFAAGAAVMLLGIATVAAVTFTSGQRYAGVRSDALWLGCFATCAVAGYVAGRTARRLAVWELHLAVLGVGALLAVHLWRGWHFVFGVAGTDRLSTWDLLHLDPPGARYLGPMWERVLALGLAGGFLLAVFGASWAFLLHSDLGRLEPRLGFEWSISRRHLVGQGRRFLSSTALVAIAGIGLGVAALVTTNAVMSGYESDVRDKILSLHPHLVVRKYGIDFVEYEALGDKVLAVQGTVAAAPFVLNEAMISDGDRGIGVLVKGVVPARADAVTGAEKNLCAMQAERCLPEPGLRFTQVLEADTGIVLGDELARRLGVELDDTVVLTTPIGMAAARGNAPRRLPLRLTGLFHSGIFEYDSRMAYVTLGTAQRLFGTGSAVYGLEVRVSDPDRTDELEKRVQRAVGGYPYVTQDWRSMNAGIFTALSLLRVVIFLVLLFIVVVASFNIASTLFMAVVERAREIAILKSMGAHDASVMRIFVTQGWIIGGAGTLLGLCLGLGVTLALGQVSLDLAGDVYMVDRLTVRLEFAELLATVLASLVISHLATLYPALRAARQRPVEAMRYE